jgi:hypothetical protein
MFLKNHKSNHPKLLQTLQTLKLYLPKKIVKTCQNFIIFSHRNFRLNSTLEHNNQTPLHRNRHINQL